MPAIDRQMMMDYLTKKWRNYVAAYRSLSVGDQEKFLQRQGYRRLADLLAHVIAWWESGMRAIEIYRVDPAYEPPPVNVDAFNAAAVADAQDKSEEQVVRLFEETQKNFIELINSLSEDNFRDPRITRQLEMELVGHLAEHVIEKDPER
ncbi:MAG TPA: DinB family protein [Anaerolineaceae bacterium]|nr:DinB family protein [Anaerolineaceae bacterium]